MRLDLYLNIGQTEILKAIGLEEDKIPRIRGIGIEDNKILIHTRTGGGNREHYGTVKSYVEGEGGLNESITQATAALTNFDDYRWTIQRYHESDFDDYKEFWKVPYEAQYTPPETPQEWQRQRRKIKKQIETLKKHRDEVIATKAYTNEYMTSNEHFISDEDDDFDSTYANFWFEIPKQYKYKWRQK